MNTWINMSDRKPTHGQEVYYYFEPVGVHKGKYKRKELPEELFNQKGIMVDVFYGGGGWLTDDVTHWMPIENTTVFPPDRPKIEVE